CALCACAPAMVPLILACALQGLGGGGLMTLAQAIIADVVSPRERGRYAGYFSIVWGSSSVLGPTLGGLIAQHYGWPWIFWINLPISLAALLVADGALRKLPIHHHRSAIDYAGIAPLRRHGGAAALAVAGRQPAALDVAAVAGLGRGDTAARRPLHPQPGALAGTDRAAELRPGPGHPAGDRRDPHHLRRLPRAHHPD